MELFVAKNLVRDQLAGNILKSLCDSNACFVFELSCKPVYGSSVVYVNCLGGSSSEAVVLFDLLEQCESEIHPVLKSM
jgi:ATP-dependent protease ClpP protease subunit